MPSVRFSEQQQAYFLAHAAAFTHIRTVCCEDGHPTTSQETDVSTLVRCLPNLTAVKNFGFSFGAIDLLSSCVGEQISVLRIRSHGWYNLQELETLSTTYTPFNKVGACFSRFVRLTELVVPSHFDFLEAVQCDSTSFLLPNLTWLDVISDVHIEPEDCVEPLSRICPVLQHLTISTVRRKFDGVEVHPLVCQLANPTLLPTLQEVYIKRGEADLNSVRTAVFVWCTGQMLDDASCELLQDARLSFGERIGNRFDDAEAAALSLRQPSSRTAASEQRREEVSGSEPSCLSVPR